MSKTSLQGFLDLLDPKNQTDTSVEIVVIDQEGQVYDIEDIGWSSQIPGIAIQVQGRDSESDEEE